MSEDKQIDRIAVPMNEDEYLERLAQAERWDAGRRAYPRDLDTSDHPVWLFIHTYLRLLWTYGDARERNPGRMTAATNAVRSLDSAIRALLFEEGIVV